MSGTNLISLGNASVAYEKFLRSMRLIRLQLISSIGYTLLLPLEVLIVVFFYPPPSGLSLFVVVFVGIVSFLMIPVGYSMFYAYRLAVSGSVKACRFFSRAYAAILIALLGLPILVIIVRLKQIFAVDGVGLFNVDARFIGFNNLDLKEINQAEPWGVFAAKQAVVSTAIADIVLTIVLTLGMLLIAWLSRSGVKSFVDHRDKPFGTLFSDKSVDTSFFIPRKHLWTTVGRFLGVFSPSRYAGKKRGRVLLVILLAALVDGYGIKTLNTLIMERNTYATDSYSRQLLGTTGQETVQEVFLTIMITVAGKLILCFGLLGASKRLRQWVQKDIMLSLDELRLEDQRTPVLFLRSFSDDQLSLKATKAPFLLRFVDPGGITMNLEQMLVKNCDHIGPVISIGKPSDRIPPLGAARTYVEDESWREVAASLIQDSAFIIVGVAPSQGLAWEIKEIQRQNVLKKTLFLVPPEYASNHNFLEDLCASLGAKETVEQHKRLAIPYWTVHYETAQPTYYVALMFSTGEPPMVLAGTRVTEVEYELAIRYFLERTTQWNFEAQMPRGFT
ncbi:hypothetical protein [Nitrospira sp. Nam74]